MNTITVKDLVSQLQQASPEARVVFRIECEDKNFDASLEFSRVTCLSPATEVVVTMADNTEDLREHIISMDNENCRLESRWRVNRDQLKASKEKILKALDDL